VHHRGGDSVSAARRLRIAPTAAEVLADEISAICEQIDVEGLLT